MILDKQAQFSDDQDLAQTAGAYDSTNIIDFGAPGTPIGAAGAVVREMGYGTPMPILIQITEDFASGGAATLQVALQVDDNTGFSSATTVWTSQQLALADMVAGKVFELEYMPRGVNERYGKLVYTIGTATTTAGKITAGVTMGNQANVH